MRMPHHATKILKIAAILGLVAISAMMAGSNSRFSTSDKAYYADANTVAFVRPGLVVKILSGAIAADGTITAKVRMTDPRGLPLDRDGSRLPAPSPSVAWPRTTHRPDDSTSPTPHASRPALSRAPSERRPPRPPRILRPAPGHRDCDRRIHLHGSPPRRRRFRQDRHPLGRLPGEPYL